MARIWVPDGKGGRVEVTTIKGEPGPKGDRGEPGPPMKFADLSDAEKAEIKGEKGDKGDTGPRGPHGSTGPAGTTQWSGIQGKPSTFPPASHTHTSAQITDASNDIGDGKGGKVVQSRGSDGKVFTYTPVEQVNNPMELVAKNYVDSRIELVTRAGSDPNVLYLIAE